MPTPTHKTFEKNRNWKENKSCFNIKKTSAITFCRGNWLSPVIQATCEARTVGWLEKERSLHTDRMISVAALWPTCLGRSSEEVKLLWRKKASSTMQEQKDVSSSPSQRLSNIARPSSLYCNCTKKHLENPIKKSLKIHLAMKNCNNTV